MDSWNQEASIRQERFCGRYCIRKGLLPPTPLWRGGLLQLPASQPWLSHSETVHLSSHSAKPSSPMLISFGRAPAPRVTSVTAGHMNDFNPKLPVTRKGWPRLRVITTQWLCLSRSLQGNHQDASLSSVSNFPWLPFWDLGTQPNLVSPLWLIPRLPCHKSERPPLHPQGLIPPAGRQFRISCRHGCPN